MLHAVIIAGGSGTRFWPRSRAHRPKQHLPIATSRTMLQDTVERFIPKLPPDNVYIITSEALAADAREQVSELPRENVVGEPFGRDTAACIGLAALMVKRRDPEGVMAVLPADQTIKPVAKFLAEVDFAAERAARDEVLMTFGIRPAEPAVVYGYIHRAGMLLDSPFKVYRVEAFKEKPDRATAQQFLDSGEYYWNSGMFVWRADTILHAIEQDMPQLHEGLGRIQPALGTPEEAKVIAREYEQLEKISIDYGVMEKAGNVEVIEAEFEWDDVGSWQAMERLHGRDERGNTALGKHCTVDTENCILVGDDDHLVATVGVRDIIVVHTEDATLVCRRDQAQKVKALVDELKEKGETAYI